jgi:uncharacterized protein (TIGR03437 family)
MAAPALINATVLVARRHRPAWLLWMGWSAALFAIVYVIARALRDFSSSYGPTFAAIGVSLLDEKTRNIAEGVAAGVCLIAALLAPKLRWNRWSGVEARISNFARHRTRAIVLVGLLPVIVRLGMLPSLPVPQPTVHDEFGYLLLADTFASGRLTNPTHPFWKHFEAIYIFHHPTYNSQYPVAPALLLAIPEVFGAHPWIGLCLGAGLMCALICWMLQAWVPPRWALLGGLLAACRFGIVSSWVNTYWGGTAAAIGGVLVVGSLPRILKYWRTRDSLLLALGLAILAQSRPYEGLLFSLPLLAMLLVRFLRERRVSFRMRLAHTLVPLAVALLAFAGWMAYYNWRVTGHPLLMPYALNQKLYGTPQSFFWQPPLLNAPGIHDSKDIADVFDWQLKAYREGFKWSNQAQRLGSFWGFYLQPLLTLTLLWLPLVMRDGRIRLLVLAAALTLVGNSFYPFFFPHYAAPICGVILLVIVQGMRHLRAWSAFAFRALVLLIFASTLVTAAGGLLNPAAVDTVASPRSKVIQQLQALGGKHLVLVRYSPDHSFHLGVIYNNADIDRSPIVWARALDPASNLTLVNYYRDRKAWIFNPDEEPVKLVPFTDKPYITVVAGGGGTPEDLREGVSPGEIAVVLGANFAQGIQGTTNAGMLGLGGLRLIEATAQHGDVFRSEAGGISSRTAAPFPLSVANVSVQFGGRPAPVLAVSNFGGQESVTVQVPFDLPLGRCAVTLQVGAVRAAQQVQVLRATPGILQARLSDTQLHAVLLRSDGSLVDRKYPARRGESLKLLATGLGSLYPPVATNEPGPDPPIARPIYKLVLGVNNHGVPLFTADYAPSLVGVEEIGFQVPADVPAGQDIPLLLGLKIGDRTVYSNRSSFPVAGLDSSASRKNLPLASGAIR